jgi:uncharacterized membrane protein
MERTLLNVTLLVELAAIAGFMLLYPRIVRKGLVFGVYIGEARSDSEDARAITRSWYRGMIAATVVAAALAVALSLKQAGVLAMLAPTVLLTTAFTALYLRAHREARRLAPEPGTPVPDAPAGDDPPAGLALPWAALVAGAVAGLAVIAYTAARYGALPDRMPTHFGLSGEADGWSRKSAGTVMVLPLMTLVMSVTMGGAALLTGRAKRGLRLDDGTSLAAQNRYRTAMSRYLAVLGLLVAAMLASLSVFSVQIALGERTALPAPILFIGGAVFLYGILGAVWLALRYGQGGSRLEGSQAAAPLTDGLADNRLWRLGVFYVNRDDPSWLVEHRFGLGYSINFGNPRAVATFAAFIGAILGLALWLVVSSS